MDESLYHWNVILASVCPDSMLNQDLIRLKKDGDKDGIHMSLTFNENYPIEPPFVQITYPAIKGNSFEKFSFFNVLISFFDL